MREGLRWEKRRKEEERGVVLYRYSGADVSSHGSVCDAHTGGPSHRTVASKCPCQLVIIIQ